MEEDPKQEPKTKPSTGSARQQRVPEPSQAPSYESTYGPNGEPGHEPGDDAREEKRARVYGLGLNNLLDQPIVVSPGKYVRLSGLNFKTDERGLVRLQPKDLDDVKRWIGVPDSLGSKRTCCGNLPAEVPGIATGADFRRLDANSQRSVRDLAYQYVHGDSRPLAGYKSMLSGIVDRAVITGVFLRLDIDIHAGAVLEIGKDVKVLFARHIRIWRGGLLKITGAVKVDCVSINGDLLNVVAAVDLLPAFATVLTRGVARG